MCACSNLQSNQLSGSIPSSLGSLTGLQILCVRRTALSLQPAVLRLRGVPARARSWLGQNQLSGTLPSSLGSLTGLQQLCVRRLTAACAALQHLSNL